MRRTVVLITAAGALAALTACGPAATGSSSSPSTSSTALPPAGASSAGAAPTPVVTTPAPSTAAFVAFAMPKVVGMDLQSAQNIVQTHGIFYSTSHDLRGSRHQIVDSDWIVCTQNLRAGQQVTSD